MKKTALLTASCAALLLVGCDKDQKTTVPDDATANEPASNEDSGPPQEPDPPELAQASRLYLSGQYQEAISLLEPLYSGLKDREQRRASGLAGGWLALSHAQIVFENAEEPAQYSMTMAEKTQDPDVVAMAKLAHGAFLLGNEDYQAARTSFDAAASAAPGTTAAALAHILRAEALIGSAFGSGASTDVQNPADLEAAKQAYDAAAKAASSTEESELLLGRSEEGLAAIAKFQGNREAICKHALASLGHYQAAGASDFLIDGPSGLAADHGCNE